MEIVLYLLRAEIVPLLKNQPGLLQLGLVPAPRRDKITILSAWTCAEAARAVEQKCCYLKAVRKLEPYLTREITTASGSFNPLAIGTPPNKTN